MKYDEWLAHFNPNHDPDNGQFTDSPGGNRSSSKSVDKSSSTKYNKSEEKTVSKSYPQSSDKWKRAAKIGAVALGATLAAVGGAYLYKSGKLDKFVTMGKNAVSKYGGISMNESGGFLNRSKRVVGRSPDQLNLKMISKINGPGPVDATRKINCTHTTTAYILNSLFGQKVQALPHSGIDEVSGRISLGRDSKIFHAMFDGIKEIDLMKQHALPAKLKRPAVPNIHMDWMEGLDSLPSGTGILCLGCPGGGGHVVNYEKTADGLLTLIDSQRNIVKSGADVRGFQWEGGGYKLLKALDFSNATLRDNAAEVLKNMVK